MTIPDPAARRAVSLRPACRDSAAPLRYVPVFHMKFQEPI